MIHFFTFKTTTMKKSLLFLLFAGLSLPLFAQWQKMSTNLPDSALVNWISSPSPNVVWGTSVDWAEFGIEPQPFIVRTIDGGATWTTSLFKDTYSEWATDIAALDENNAFVITFDFATGEGSVYRTSDGGTSWQELNEADNGIAFDDPFGFPNIVHFWDHKNGIILGDPDITGHFEIYTTRDGGDHWIKTEDPDLLAAADGSEFGTFNGFGANGANTIFFASSPVHHRIFKSDDRGLSWKLVESPYEGDTTSFNSITSFVFEDERRGLAFTQYNPNYPGGSPELQSPQLRTDDGGETWQPVTTANYTEYQERGAAVKVPGADCQYVIGHYNQAVSYTDDCGASYTYDTTIAGVGLEFHSPTDGWLSLFYLGGTGGEIAKFTGNLSPSTMRNITLRVDMSGVSVNPAGVHLASSLNGWSTSATPMTSVGNGYYEVTMQVPVGTTFKYKFINGNSWGQNESVPAGCSTVNSEGGTDRTYTVGQWDARLPAICFGSCISCGDAAPAGAFYCENGSLQCEIFDWYDVGAVSSPRWSGNGADVTSYYHGFTNYSGGRSLHVDNGDWATYKLGNRAGSTYEISLKMYVPGNHESHFSLLTDQDDPNSSVFDYTLQTNRTAWDSDGSYLNYPQNEWFDVKISANTMDGHISIWINGAEAWSGSRPVFNQLGGIAFHGSKYSDFFVDDIALRDINDSNFKPSPGVARSFAGSKIYPNPASDVLFVPYEFSTSGNLSLTLTDAAGRTAFFTELSDAQAGVEDIRCEGFAPGVYFLRIKHPDGERTERVVLQTP